MRKPLRFIVTGRDQGIRVCVVYRMQGAAIRYAKRLTETEVYDILENKYVYGTTRFCRMLLAGQQDMTIKFGEETEMYKAPRYKVDGKKDGVPCTSMFKQQSAALRFADKLTDVEVYDTQTKEYIHGTTRFYRNLQREKLNALFVQ